MGHFFSLSHLLLFFCCIIRKYLPHILFWSQLVSVCFAMELFFSFKIHCLQMFQLFQTRDGPFSSILTLVAHFLLHHEKIFVPYIFGCIVKTFEEKISLYEYCISLYIVLKIPKTEEGICYSCHVVTARRDMPLFEQYML